MLNLCKRMLMDDVYGWQCDCSALIGTAPTGCLRQEEMMRLLIPIGVVLIVIGTAGYATSCLNVSDSEQTKTAAQLQGATDKAADAANSKDPQMAVAPLAGLAIAIGLVCVGIGVGNWRRPIPSDVRPANPWSDQPGEEGKPPLGQV